MERTATARGMSGHVDLSDSVMIEIRGDKRVGKLGLAAKQALDLRERRQHALLRPALDLSCGELQQGRQVLVACEAESGAQRAFTHPAIDQDADSVGVSRLSRVEATGMKPQQRERVGCARRL